MTHGGLSDDEKTNIEARFPMAHMISNATPRKHLDGISKAISQKDNPLNVDTLNAYIHNRFFSPTERDLRVAWDNSQPFFEKIWP